MTTDSTGGAPDAPLTLHGMSGGRRRKRGLNLGAVVLGAIAVVGVGAGAAVLKFGSHVVPAGTLRKGVPSIAAAERCLRNHDVPCAQANYIAYLKKYPDDVRANAVLAIVLTQDGRHREALPYYRKAETLGVDTYDFHANRARTLEATGDLDGAIRANYRALALVPSLVDVRGALAEQLVRKGRADEAVNLLETFDHSLADRAARPTSPTRSPASAAAAAGRPADRPRPRRRTPKRASGWPRPTPRRPRASPWCR